MELLERAGELQSLQGALDDARKGRGTTALLCGDAGIGKTSLIRAFLSSVDDVTVLLGGCDDLIAPRSFGPFRDMARRSDHLPADLETAPERENLLGHLLDLMERTLRPTIAVIEDVHWADDASLDVIRYLMRRMPSLPALLVLSLRDRELPEHHPLSALTSGPSDRPPLLLRLQPLSPAAIAELAAETDLDAAYLHEVSGGNPFYVGQMLAASSTDIAESVRDTVLARADRLSPSGKDALRLLSVMPAGADASLARMLFAEDPDALHDAEGCGLLEVRDDRITFRHDLGREAIERSLTFGQRMALNHRVLEALVASNADRTSLVHVARAAGDAARATEFALDVLRGELAPTNHREVWTLSRIALEHTAGLDDLTIADLHMQAAEAGRTTNNHSAGRDHAEEAVRILRATGAGSSELAQAWMLTATASASIGENERSAHGFEQARRMLEALPPEPNLATCYCRLGAIAMITGRHEEGSRWANLAIDLCEEHGWQQPLVCALGVRGTSRSCRGDEGGFSDLERARELGAMYGPVERHAINVYNSAVCLLRWCRPIEAAPLIDEAERLAREHGFDHMVYRARIQQGIVLIMRGDVDAAERLLEELAAADARQAGAIRGSALAALGRIYARRGDPRAEGTIEQAWKMSLTTGEHQKVAVAGISKLELAWLERRDDEVRMLATRLLDVAERTGHLRLRAEALRYLLRIGDDVEPFEGCPAAYEAALSGNFGRAAALWDRAGQPYEYALELVESTDPSLAFEGLRTLDRLGATRTADLARLRLRSRGFASVPRGPRRANDGTVPVLTDRQFDVMELLARGLTNQEIADELFVARRTVDNHVSAILTRLDVDSRHDAVQEAEARGLLGAT